MKKILSTFLGISLLFTLVACSSNDVSPTDTTVTNTEIVDESPLKQEDETVPTENTVSTVEKKDTTSKTQVKNEKIVSYKDSKIINNANEIVGKNIDFNIGVNVKVGTGEDINPRVATSYSQLVDAYNDANGENYYGTNYISKYKEEFFENKAVIMLFLYNSIDQYSLYPYKIESVTVKDNTIYVNRSIVKSKENGGDYITAESLFRVCIEVDKADLENVKYLSLTTLEIDG